MSDICGCCRHENHDDYLRGKCQVAGCSCRTVADTGATSTSAVHLGEPCACGHAPHASRCREFIRINTLCGCDRLATPPTARRHWDETNTGCEQRCNASNGDDGRGACQLRVGHQGSHAGYGEFGSIITWEYVR